MLMIRINKGALITGRRMKRMQQDSIMTKFLKPGFVFWICIDGF